MKVYLALGSNIGKLEENFNNALDELKGIVRNIKSADWIKSEPMYDQDQAEFLNTVIEADTELSPEELLKNVLEIEIKLGRQRLADRPKGPRIIDIDILLYGDLIINKPHLQIPHPGIEERPFVLEPLLQLKPDINNPVTGVTYVAKY